MGCKESNQTYKPSYLIPTKISLKTALNFLKRDNSIQNEVSLQAFEPQIYKVFTALVAENNVSEQKQW